MHDTQRSTNVENFTLRSYQSEIITKIRQALGPGRFKRPLVQLPTGAGKTRIFTEIVRTAAAKGKKVVIFVPKVTLINQTASVLDRLGVDFGVMQANHERTDHDKPIQLATVQTVMRRRHAPDCDLILIDEAHRQFDKLNELLARWDRVPVIGFSATPWSKGLGKVFDTLIKGPEISELIAGGFLVDADVYAPDVPDMKGVDMIGDDFNQKQATERFMSRVIIGNIIDHWHRLASGKKTMVAAANIAHSQSIVDSFNAVGVSAAHVDCYTSTADREVVFEAFVNGDLTVISSVNVLSEGADFPLASCLIIARPTASLIFHFQVAGRVLRPYDGKEKATIIDHAGNFVRLGFLTDSTPDYLDIGERRGSSQRLNEEGERLGKVCPCCKLLLGPEDWPCPECGFEPRATNEVFEQDGDLKLIKSKERKIKVKEMDSRDLMSQLRGYCLDRGKQDGYAWHLYKTITGKEMGSWKAIEPVYPCQAVLNEIKRCQIARIKAVGGLY